jgi:hypothetical protein
MWKIGKTSKCMKIFASHINLNVNQKSSIPDMTLHNQVDSNLVSWCQPSLLIGNLMAAEVKKESELGMIS